ncbi:Lectin C-type domain family protein [Acanthocheilonema viteae]
MIGADSKSCRVQKDCDEDQICDEKRCIPDLQPVLAMKESKKQSPYCYTNYHCKYWQKCLNGVCMQNFGSLPRMGNLEGLIAPSSSSKPVMREKIPYLETHETAFETPKKATSETANKTSFDAPREATFEALNETTSGAMGETRNQELGVTVSLVLDETVPQIADEEISQAVDETQLQTSTETVFLTTTMADSILSNSEMNSWISKTTICRVNADCTTNEICRDRKCIPVDWLPNTIACANDSQCNVQQLCAVDGYCVLDPSFPKFGPRCDTNKDCKKSGICRNGRCYISYPYTKCRTNEQCAIDEICVVAGYCVPDPHSKLHGAEPCDESWWQFRQKCYLPVHGSFTFTEGSDYCAKVDANLVTIRDIQQANYVNYMYNAGGNGTYWIGLLKDINGIFKWQSGESVIYTDWEKGKPEPRIGCVIADVTKFGGKWFITDCIEIMSPDQGFICEKDVHRI